MRQALACLLILGITSAAQAAERHQPEISRFTTLEPEWPAAGRTYDVGCIELTLDPGATALRGAIEGWAAAHQNPVCPAGVLPARHIRLAELKVGMRRGVIGGSINWQGQGPEYAALFHGPPRSLARFLDRAVWRLAEER